MVSINGKQFVQGHFPNGESDFADLGFLKLDTDHASVELYYEGDHDMFHLQVLAEYLKDLGAMSKAHLVIRSWVPYAQMDRKVDGHAFSLKYVAKLVNRCGFPSVYIDDPHSDVSAALLDNVTVSYSTANRMVHDVALHKNADIVMYPDSGAAKKYNGVITSRDMSGFLKPDNAKTDSAVLGVPVIYGMKRRDQASGEIVSYDIVTPEGVDVNGKRVAIMDDLVMGGRTFVEAAKRLREMGASSVVLYVSHITPQASEFISSLGGGMLDAVFTPGKSFTKKQ